MSEEQGKPKIKVTDRRTSRQEEDDAASQNAKQTSSSPESPAPNQASAETAYDYPALDFNTFILSLSTSALVHMGVVQDPNSGQVTKNLEMAKQTIDLIGLLEEKTKGNLSGEEERLLGQILYDLRMKFVRVSKETSST